MAKCIFSPGLEMYDTKDFEVHEKLGEGSYGAVHKVKVKRKNTWLAVKKVGMETYDEGLPACTLREVSSLLLLKGHPNIVSLLAVFHDEGDGSLMLGFELCSGGDLSDFLEKYDGGYDSDSQESTQSGKGRLIPIGTMKHLIKQIATGIAYMHSHNIIHRDVKPMNILLNGDITSVKICDLGMARCMTDGRLLSREVSTIYYRAPEVLLSSCRYEVSSDVWSVGCVFAEILCHGRVAFKCGTEVGLLMTLFRIFGTPTPISWPGVRHLPDWSPAFPVFAPAGLRSLPYFTDETVDFLAPLLTLDPSQRCTVESVLSHPFMQ